ncbi:mechanosensitive ion channel [Sphingomonas sp. HDW15A]|uniref:mechanosensitive ion channel family protein n=1 Tax=Sphingomonas sp. HDW15A TaxID=2714942 RepID=UPI001407568B|nr:mechanosensitive ion channel domain-containing protein [Sphingomonas sp. HDW15A]QIK96300.1 mechanosensitive ion channel [Sphingomonas sp. HDW15A]
MISSTPTLTEAADRTGDLAERGAAPVFEIAKWLGDNLHGLMIGALVATGIVGVMLLLRALGRKMLEGDPECRRWRGIIGNVLARTGILFMVAAAIDIVVSYAPVPPKLARLADIIFIIAAALQVAVWAREIVIGVVKSRVGEDPGASTLGNAMSLIRVLVSVAAFAIAFIVILDNLGVNVTALVAGLGIGGIAIGLAAQGIFSDLFAALSIVFDRPFRRGDTIRYGGAAGSVGTVERIGLKTTRIRSITGEQLVMANTKLLEQELTNIAELKVRRTWLTFGLTYQTPAEVIERLPEILEEAVKPIKSCRLIRSTATQFGPSSIDCELIYDDRTSDADTLAKHKSAIIVAIMRIFAREKIDFAYPTQTTFTAAPDGTLVMPYAQVQPALSVDEPDQTQG